MNEQATQQRFSIEQRQQFIYEYQRSGLNQSEFARQHGLLPGTFRQWVRRQRAKADVPVQGPELREVTLGELLGPPLRWAVEVVLNHKTTLRLSEQVPWSLVERLLERLS